MFKPLRKYFAEPAEKFVEDSWRANALKLKAFLSGERF